MFSERNTQQETIFCKKKIRRSRTLDPEGKLMQVKFESIRLICVKNQNILLASNVQKCDLQVQNMYGHLQ